MQSDVSIRMESFPESFMINLLFLSKVEQKSNSIGHTEIRFLKSLRWFAVMTVMDAACEEEYFGKKYFKSAVQ